MKYECFKCDCGRLFLRCKTDEFGNPLTKDIFAVALGGYVQCRQCKKYLTKTDLLDSNENVLSIEPRLVWGRTLNVVTNVLIVLPFFLLMFRSMWQWVALVTGLTGVSFMITMRNNRYYV